jgi:hypothetical protein
LRRKPVGLGPRLVAELHAQFAESAKLEQAIKVGEMVRITPKFADQLGMSGVTQSVPPLVTSKCRPRGIASQLNR